MILTEDRTSTIEFSSEFAHIDYFKNTKVIVVAFELSKEANLFHNVMVNKYVEIYNNINNLNNEEHCYETHRRKKFYY